MGGKNESRDRALLARWYARWEKIIARLPFGRKHYQKYLPFMPRALEALDLRGYDLVISSEAGPAKGIVTDPDTLHIYYCHSPMRYIWDQYHVYREQSGFLTRILMALMAHRLRIWDVTTAAQVDYFVANSAFISRVSRNSTAGIQLLFIPLLAFLI